MNDLRNGMSGDASIILAEVLDGYQEVIRAFFNVFKPGGTLERHLVQFLADTSWRLDRVAALESNLIALGFDEHSNSISTEHPEAHAELVIIEAMRDETRALGVLGLHTARLCRSFEKTLQQLKEAQKERRAPEAQQRSQPAAP